jgi:hypothetical protein
VTISAIQLRLDNWGRWGRGERFFSAQTSPLYQLYRENNPDILTDAPQRPRMTDPADAFKVDQAIAQSLPERYAETEVGKASSIQTYLFKTQNSKTGL